MRSGDPAEPVPDVAAGVADALDLGVLAVGVGDLEVPGLDLAAHLGRVQQRPAGQPVHLLHQALQAVRGDEVRALVEEGPHGCGGALAEQPVAQDGPAVLGGDVGVLLGAGERELLLDDLPGEDEPGVVVAGEVLGSAQVPEGAQGVVARQAGVGETAAEGVEPDGGRAGQDADAVAGPDGVPVLEALGVVPHAVAVDEPYAGLGADVEHAAVDVGRDAGDHLGGGRAEPFGPVAADDVVVGADAAGGHDDGLGGEFELAGAVASGGGAARGVVGGEDRAAHAAGRAALDDQFVDPVAVVEGEQSVPGGLPGVPDEGLDHAGAGAPGDVEAGHGVAVSVRPQVAALGPADGGQQFDAVSPEPGPLLAGRELDVGAGPAHRPGVLVGEPVEPGAALPVVPGEAEGVLDAEAALLGRVDEEEPAEGPVRLAAEVGGVLLLDQGHPAAPAGEFVRGDEAGEARSDDDDVRVHGVCVLPSRCS